MKLFAASTYIDRRQRLLSKVESGLIIFIGNNEAPMNYADNHYRFRQDSSFLYFFGINLPGMAATMDTSTGEVVIYGDDFTVTDIIWMGNQPKLADLGAQVGVSKIASSEDFKEVLKSQKGPVHYLPPYRFDTQIMLSKYLGIFTNKVSQKASKELIKAVVSIREIKTPEEIEQMTEAVNISGKMHKAAMRTVAEGKYEYQVVSKIYEAAMTENAHLSYPAICTVNGQTLHNHYHGNMMKKGQLLLNDSGAENEMAYSGDITRTCPVDGKFSQKQKEIYLIVSKMIDDCITNLKPGKTYNTSHQEANVVLLEGLKDLGLLKGDVSTMLEEGVGGMFMPHGLGHQIGMDVHDMEDLGEQLVGYGDNMTRSTQLGLKSLRLAKELKEGFVITVEPGIYFIPDLIEKLKAEGAFKEFVNYDKLKAYYNFGGIRLEDDVLITSDGSEILGDLIPRSIEDVESLMQN